MDRNDISQSGGDLPWRAALLSLAAVGTSFVVGYRWTNALAAADALPWLLETTLDRAMPFLPWTVLPYLSLNLLYPLSFFLCVGRSELVRHCKRLLTAQGVCFIGFWLFPLHNRREFPLVEGFLGVLWKELRAFDGAGNLAPSLHAATLVVVWDLLRRTSIVAVPRLPLDLWFLLIAISTLTTWQHYVFDLVTGLILGLGCVLLFPLVPSRKA